MRHSQLLHLVFGGEVTAPDSVTFKDLSKLHIVGIYPNYKRPMPPGAPPRRPPWTTHKCAISWSIFTACWNRTLART